MLAALKRSAVCLGVLLYACGGTAPDDDIPGQGSAATQDQFGTSPASGGGGGEARACASDAECGSGGVCNPATKVCACGGTAIAAEIVPANMLIVLDRSCSMKNKVGAQSKWSIAVSAIGKLVTKSAGKVRFGLELFPDTTGASCAQDKVAVPVASGTEGQISKMLTDALVTSNALYPNGPCVTNIDTGILGAKNEGSLRASGRESFVLLVTDGAQSSDCTGGGGDKGTTKAIADMHAEGIDTFVVGFGAEVDAAQLAIFAQAGGQARVGAAKAYYDAADEPSLDAALTAITKKTMGCTMKLGAPPPNGDPSLLYVFLDASPAPLARDATHATGWDYDAASQSVTFYGDRCDALRAGTIQKASVMVGCAGGPAPENPVK